MLIIKVLFLFLLSKSYAVGADKILPPDQAFMVSAKILDTNYVEISWIIAEGYYLYRNKMRFESKNKKIDLGYLPLGINHHDEYFGDVPIYRNLVDIPIPVGNSEFIVQYQGCADIGVCYPPEKIKFYFNNNQNITKEIIK